MEKMALILNADYVYMEKRVFKVRHRENQSGQNVGGSSRRTTMTFMIIMKAPPDQSVAIAWRASLKQLERDQDMTAFFVRHDDIASNHATRREVDGDRHVEKRL